MICTGLIALEHCIEFFDPGNMQFKSHCTKSKYLIR